MEGSANPYGLAQVGRSNVLAIACSLNIGGMWRAMIAEHDWQAGHTLPPDQPDLDLFAPLRRDDRGKSAIGEVRCSYSRARLFEHFSNAKRNWLKMRGRASLSGSAVCATVSQNDQWAG